MKTTNLRQEREERRRQENRRLILEAAERVILAKGTSALTMDDVAREAAFSKATLYRYFRNKGELVQELLVNYFEEVKEELRRIQSSKLAAGDKLKRSIHFYIHFSQAKGNLSRMLMMDPGFMEKMRILVANDKRKLSEKDRRFIDTIRAKRREILEGAAEILKEGIASGEFQKVDPQSAIIFLESILWGYCHTRFWREKTLNVREATELIHHFFLKGIEKKSSASKGESR